MDPWFWFGISGALVTGKVAATAITDPERATREFQGFTRNFKLIYSIKNRFWYPFFRPNVKMSEKMVNMIGPANATRMNELVDRVAAKGTVKIELVPGFGRYNYH